MDSHTQLKMRSHILLDEVDNKLDDFNESCEFIEMHIDKLNTEDANELLSSFLAVQLYGYLYGKHLEDERKWIIAFQSNEFQLQQCIYRLERMLPEMDIVLEKIFKIKELIQTQMP